MEGADLAAQRKLEFDVALAWHVMAIGRENEGKRSLIPLSKYLERIKPHVGQTADDVAAVFLALKGRGKSVKIRERKRSA